MGRKGVRGRVLARTRAVIRSYLRDISRIGIKESNTRRRQSGRYGFQRRERAGSVEENLFRVVYVE